MKVEITKMKFKNKTYFSDHVTSFRYAFSHPIISSRLSIKYIIRWAYSVDYSLTPRIYRYYYFLYALMLHSFLCMYTGLTVRVLAGFAEPVKLINELWLIAGIAFLGNVTLLTLICGVIKLLEKTKIAKEDNLFLYNTGFACLCVFTFIMAIGI